MSIKADRASRFSQSYSFRYAPPNLDMSIAKNDAGPDGGAVLREVHSVDDKGKSDGSD